MRAWSLWLALIAAATGCEKILGIHDSHLRDGGADGPSAGSAGGPPTDGGAGAGGAVAGSGGAGAAGTGGGSGGGAGTGGAVAGGGGAGAAGTAPDAGPTRDAMTDATEVGDVSPPQDATPEAPPPKCPSSVVNTSLKMFEFSAGPHGIDKGLGACEYPVSFLPPDATHYYAAAPASLLGGGTACGACLLVSNQQGTVSREVQIIDNSGSAAINIDHDAYQEIDPTFNNPMVNVRFVTCTYAGTIWAHFRGAGDPAVLLYGFTTRPKTVEILGPGDAPTALRQVTNYWEPPVGYVPGGTARLRLTDELGAVVTTGALSIDGVFHDTGQQFPTCAP